MKILKQTANDVVKIFMQGMEQKSNGWIFCNDYPGTTPLTENAYQKQLTVKQVRWLVNVSARNDGQITSASRGGKTLDGWMDS